MPQVHRPAAPLARAAKYLDIIYEIGFHTKSPPKSSQREGCLVTLYYSISEFINFDITDSKSVSTS
jgi:hypothetical protein